MPDLAPALRAALLSRLAPGRVNPSSSASLHGLAYSDQPPHLQRASKFALDSVFCHVERFAASREGGDCWDRVVQHCGSGLTRVPHEVGSLLKKSRLLSASYGVCGKADSAGNVGYLGKATNIAFEVRLASPRARTSELSRLYQQAASPQSSGTLEGLREVSAIPSLTTAFNNPTGWGALVSTTAFTSKDSARGPADV